MGVKHFLVQQEGEGCFLICQVHIMRVCNPSSQAVTRIARALVHTAGHRSTCSLAVRKCLFLTMLLSVPVKVQVVE